MRRRILTLVATLPLVAGCALASGTDPSVPTGAPSDGLPTPGASASPTTARASDGTATGPSAGPASSPRPLPACRYRDEPVLGDPDRDWATLVLDTVSTLPQGWAPERLVGTRRVGLPGGFEVSRVMIDDLGALADAARDAGVPIAVQSAYRSYAYQVTTFQGWVARSSEREARQVSARPGHSEHQLGTAVDLRSAGDARPPWELDDFAETPTGAWLAEHAWEHGFVMSYPDGAHDETCYSYEPWHYRYVGRDVAAAVHESGLTPRRYLWETYWAQP